MTNLRQQSRTHLACIFLGTSVLVGLLGGCAESREQADPQFGTESHFLLECEGDRDCGENLTCLGGRCSVECQADSDCVQLHEQAECVDTPGGSGLSCDVACDGPKDCTSLAADGCTADHCREPALTGAEPESVGSPESGDASVAADAAIVDPANPPSPGGPEPVPASTIPAPPIPSPASSPSGIDAEAPSTADTDAAVASGGDAGQELDSGLVMSDPEPASALCTTSADCALATRLDVCCPACPEAYSQTSVTSDQCLYANGEPTPPNCAPDACPVGCPGASCVEPVGAVCIGGECRVSVAVELCAASTCDAGEICVDFDGSYTCLTEDCEYDRCHPERCDQIGELCCDPFPGDGANYCNGGLECGALGCEPPEGVDPERLCNNLLCPEGDVCCDKCLGTCINALSGANCPDDNSSATVCDDAFPCGPELSCSSFTQYCERFTGGPLPAEPTYTCYDLPDACVDSPSCACLAEAGRFGTCTATPEGGFQVEESAP
jgi:hypothetical protein